MHAFAPPDGGLTIRFVSIQSAELPEFQSPMISSGKRLSTPLGFLSRAKQQKAQRQTPSPGYVSLSIWAQRVVVEL